YLTDGPREVMVRNLAMTTDPAALGGTVIKRLGDRPVPLSEVAEVLPGVAPMRGDASVNGMPGVILSVDKAPGFDTLRVTAAVERALEELRPSLPPGVEVTVLFRQADFIQHALGNLREAIRDGALMVAAVLFLFLLNIRTTAITLTAIPLSFAVTLIVFRALDVSVNAMTLGGLAVALGLVVDDAIVDVENVYRRLRQNAAADPAGAGHPSGSGHGTAAEPETPGGGARPATAARPVLEVVASASAEVRHSILHATLLIILVFLPLLGLAGLEGRLFTPIAIATIVSLAASFVVSLTVIPVLCSLALRPKAGVPPRDPPVVRALKRLVEGTFLRAALGAPLPVLALVGTVFLASLLLYPRLGKNFLPPFNEGSATVTLASPPGTSLAQANEVGEVGVRLLQGIPEVRSIGRRAGRAERDDHVMPVSVNEFDLEFHPGGRPRPAVFADIRQRLGAIPGTFVVVGQPLGHRLDHMLSGVTAKIAVKVFGPDLDGLRQAGAKIEGLAREVPGLTDVFLER
ncbi:MAG TPA: efflux RND transporter permease subunit, partial [Verrucomicrobiota bacterium]|nr:efflux RND transporter permease subunit [Verrucomicrobiota bacterium]